MSGKQRTQVRPCPPRGSRRAVRRLPGALALLALGGCAGPQSTLDPRGPAAAAAAETWWVMLAGATAIFVVVMALVLYATLRAPDKRPVLNADRFILIAGLLVPTLVLTALLVYGTRVGREMVFAGSETALRIEVTGHQWWWEVRYPADGDAPEVVTANELHLPVGVPVEIALTSADVIHSFWIPQLGGKLDMFPGTVHSLRLQADEPGEFRGQCGEFCGAHHAVMTLMATAQPQAEFDAWRVARAQPAAGAATHPGASRFVDAGCADCHTVRGVAGSREVGPDLSHVGARPLLLARRGFDRERVADFLAEPQRVKPENRGHVRGLDDQAWVEELVDYLEQLR